MKESGVYYDKEIRAVVVTYSGFLTTEQFKEIAGELQELRVNNHSTRQLSNIEEMGVLTPEIQKWLHDDWFPKAKHAGLKHLVFVVPKSVFGKWSMNAVTKDDGLVHGIDIQYFSTLEQARSWLKTR
jgi:hypothetical protein